ncbi:DUF4112 domain-containing protein [Thalassobaculum salexigens]|uniref:DUF4112 domain-containing protein n=1 Tax=Thalassobaculum salexigens TaxID=455360 RepID=UPI003CD0C962
MSSASPPPPVAPIEHGEVLSPEQVEARAKVERLSTWLDTKFRIPGTNIRFGADAVAGVIPGVGDTAVFGGPVRGGPYDAVDRPCCARIMTGDDQAGLD